MADLTSVLAAELRRLDPDTAGCDAKAVYLAAAAEQWFAGAVVATEPPEHSCEWCDKGNYNHPRCPENADELKDVCPSCGGDPEDITCHAEICERVGTCGSIGPPWLDRPWHPEPERFTGEWWHEHLKTEHAR